MVSTVSGKYAELRLKHLAKHVAPILFSPYGSVTVRMPEPWKALTIAERKRGVKRAGNERYAAPYLDRHGILQPHASVRVVQPRIVVPLEVVGSVPRERRDRAVIEPHRRLVVVRGGA